MKNERKIWLVTTEHLEDGLWFRDTADFIVGMNYVGVQVAVSGVIVLVFILMSNHVHFILYGTREEVLAFIHGFKMRFSRHLHNKYGLKESLRRNGVDLRELPEEDDTLERAIAYVQMNCVAANICSHPSQYPWGCGSCFFNTVPRNGIRLGALSARAKRRLLHCAVDLPDDWVLTEDGFILPASYMNVKYVEELFQTPKRMNHFLQYSSKARKRIESGEASLPAFRDQVVLSALPDLCRTLFGKPFFRELADPERAEILRQLRFRFSCNIDQLARVSGLAYEAVARLLDRF